MSCHTLVPDSPNWPLTHLWDLTYLLTCTLDSGHSDFPTTLGTLVSSPTDLTDLPTCLPATPEDSTWLGSHMKMCTWCTRPSNRSSDAPEIHHHIMMSIKGHHMVGYMGICMWNKGITENMDYGQMGITED